MEVSGKENETMTKKNNIGCLLSWYQAQDSVFGTARAKSKPETKQRKQTHKPHSYSYWIRNLKYYIQYNSSSSNNNNSNKNLQEKCIRSRHISGFQERFNSL